MNKARTVVSLLLLAVGGVMTAQTPRLYSVTDGLRNNYIDHLYVDSDNFVWICGGGVLDIFDGTSFHHINTNDPVSGSPRFTLISNVHQVGAHRFWIVTPNGLFDYDTQTEAFTQIDLTEGGKIVFTAITNVEPYPGHDDTYIIYLVNGGCQVFDTKKMKTDWSLTRRFNALTGDLSQYHVMTDSHGRVWCGNMNHDIVWIDVEPEWKAHHPRLTPDAAIIANGGHVAQFLEDTLAGNIYIGMSRGGILVWDSATDVIRPLAGNRTDLYVMSMLWEPTNSRVLVGTDNHGILEFSTADEQVVPLNGWAGLPVDIGYAKTHSLVSDHAGNVLAGLYQKGILVIPHDDGQMFTHSILSASGGSANSACITSMVEDRDGNLYAATDGANIFKNNRILPQSENTRLAQTLVCDSDGRVWSGSWQGGITLMDADGNFNTPAWLMEYAHANVKSLCYDHRLGAIFAGLTGQGVICLDLKRHQVQSYMMAMNGLRWVSALMLDSAGWLWIGAAEGVFRFNPDTGTLINIRPSADEERAMQPAGSQNAMPSANCFLQQDSLVYIGTDGGIFCYNLHSEQMVTTPVTASVGTIKVCSILYYDHHIWLSSHAGILCIDTADGNMLRFRAFGGSDIGEFSPRSACLRAAGRMLFGGEGGIVSFSPAEVVKAQGRQRAPQVYLTEMSVQGRTIYFGDDEDDAPGKLDAPIRYAQHVRMKSGVNSFMLAFSSPEFTNPKRMVYQYTLAGYEHEWHTTNAASAHAYYASLPSGTYRFRVRSFYEDSPQNYSEAMLRITVPRPWYLSIWAIAIYVLLLVLAGVYIYQTWNYRRRQRQLLHESRLREGVKAAKLQLFSSIAHELRSPLTMIVSPLWNLIETDADDRRREQYSLMGQNCNRLLRTVSQIADISRIDSGRLQMHFRHTDFVQYATAVMQPFKGEAAAKGITFTWEHTDERIDVWIDPMQFEKVMGNLLSNAFKFTPPHDGRILVRAMIRPNTEGDGSTQPFDDRRILEYLELCVYNSGSHLDDETITNLWERFYQGRAQRSGLRGSGIGLNLAHDITLMHHGSISARNVGDEGVEFKVCLPMGCAHLTEEEMQDSNTSNADGHEGQTDTTLGDKTGMDGLKMFPTTLPSVDTPAENPPSDPPAPTEARSSVRRLVMVVDDDVELASYIATSLRPDYDVIEAYSGNDAYRKLRTSRPDVVVTDLMMADGDGFELTRRIKNNPETDHTAVIVLTNESTEQSHLRSTELQADHFLPKPFNLPLLRSALTQALRVRTNMQQHVRRTDMVADMGKTDIPPSADDELLDRIRQSVMRHLADSDYSVVQLADDVGASRGTINRKMRELLGVTPAAYIRSIRLKQAAYILISGNINVNEVADRVGFSTHSNFSHNFHQFFGMTPTEFVTRYADTDPDSEPLRKLLE